MGERKGFRELVVWNNAKDLAVKIYQVSGPGTAIFREYGLRDQIRRSAVSIPSNIAEGDERDTLKEAVHFFYIAKGSLAELRTQLQIAFETGFLEIPVYTDLEQDCGSVGKQLGRLIKVRAERHRRSQLSSSNSAIP